MGQTVGRNERVVHRRIGDTGGVLLHLDTGAYHRLNQVGDFIWAQLEQPVATDAIIGRVRASFEDCPPELEADVLAYLEALLQRGLIELEN